MPTRRSVLLGSAALLAPYALPAEEVFNADDTWSATLVRGALRLRLRFEIAAGGDVTLYSLDQGSEPISGRVDRNGKTLRLQFRSIRASYTGQFMGADRIEGHWKQGASTPLQLNRGESLAAPTQVEALTPAELARMRNDCGAPALATAFARRSAASTIWVNGNRAAGATAPVTTADLWHLGSISKSITATLVARLVERGTLSWDTRTDEVLGAVVPRMQDSYRATTFRHLLSHRAGLPADLPMVQLAGFALGDAQDVRTQRRRFAQLALQMKPVALPEASSHYSNCGYVVAGVIMETLTGESWEDLVTRHVFRPLGLESAGFGAPHAGLAGALTQPVGHAADLNAKLLQLLGGKGLRALRPGSAQQTDNPRVLGPAATVHMSLGDLMTYLAAHRDATAFLRPDTWKVLHTPPFGGDYAMGWIRRTDGSFWHNGSNTFWYAEAQWHPESGVAATAVCNESRASAMAAVSEAISRAAAAA
jgi:CubicO group peptidase (beta-lactamase class C family)